MRARLARSWARVVGGRAATSESAFAAALESTADGVLVVSDDNLILYYNRRFVEFWGIPEDLLATRDHERVRASVLSKLKDPSDFMRRTRALYADEFGVGIDRIELVDGRSFERYSTPLIENGRPRGRVLAFRDITSRLAAEEALRREMTLHETLLSAQSAVGEGLLILEGRKVVFANAAYCELTGYTLDELRRLDSLLSLTPAESHAGLRARASKVLTSEEGRDHYETTLVRKDGHRIDIEVSVKRLPGEGTPRFVSIVRDVSRRHETERLLQASEKLYHSLFNSIGDPIVVTDVSRRIVDVNTAFSRVFGYAHDDVLGKTAEFIYRDHEEYEAVGRTLAANRDAANFTLVAHLRRKSGEVFVAEAGGAAIRDPEGRVVGAIGLARDVTERHRAESERARLAAIVESSDDAIVSTSVDGVIQSWNGGAERLYGYTAAEAVGQPIATIVPDDRREELAAAWEKLRLGESVRVETARLSKHGSRVAVAITMSPIRSAEGALVAFSFTARDIRERLLAEKRARELDELREVNAFKTQLLSTASHELNTPITPLKLQLHLLKSASYGDLNEKQRRAVDVLDRNLERLSLLVRDVLDVARLQSGKLKLERALVDVGSIVTDVAESFEPAARAAGIVLETRLGAGEMNADADVRRITQVVFNLVSNALKFTPEGGRITLETRRTGDDVLVVVRDTGTGLTAEQIGRLFQPFTQVHEGDPNAPPGTGLGLYISRGILEQHGGHIWCESEGPGRGTSFAFSVPASIAPRIAPLPRVRPETRASQRERRP